MILWVGKGLEKQKTLNIVFGSVTPHLKIVALQTFLPLLLPF